MRTITLGRGGVLGADAEEAERRRAALARHWVVLDRLGHAGRLLPDTELARAQVALGALDGMSDYAAYLRAQTQAVGTEINLQIGEYTLKNHALQALPLRIARTEDFVAVFGETRHSNPIQCVEVQNSTRRTWLRLVGLRHDVELWDVDERALRPLHSRKYTDTFDQRAVVTSVADATGEEWIAAVLEPYRRQYLRDVELFLPEWDHSAQGFAALSGTVSAPPVASAGAVGLGRLRASTVHGASQRGSMQSSRDPAVEGSGRPAAVSAAAAGGRGSGDGMQVSLKEVRGHSRRPWPALTTPRGTDSGPCLAWAHLGLPCL